MDIFLSEYAIRVIVFLGAFVPALIICNDTRAQLFFATLVLVWIGSAFAGGENTPLWFEMAVSIFIISSMAVISAIDRFVTLPKRQLEYTRMWVLFPFFLEVVVFFMHFTVAIGTRDPFQHRFFFEMVYLFDVALAVGLIFTRTAQNYFPIVISKTWALVSAILKGK